MGSTPISSLIAGRYELLAELGTGGSGTVYRALDQRTGGEVALKSLRKDKQDARQLTLFRYEYHTLAQLAHPRIVSVHDYAVSETGAYYTMELLDGMDVREAAPLPWITVCRLLRDVASALAMLHARRLLHRDVSYRNVRCTVSGHAKLIDFGAMMPLGSTAEVIGTPPFIPPEAASGGALDARSDLYALGALGYFMLTARHAYPAGSLPMLQKLWSGKAPPPPAAWSKDVPPELDRLIMSLLHLERQNRPTSAAEVMDRLGAIADLPPAEDLRVAEAYLKRPALAGRQRERKRIREFLKPELEGRGVLLIEGAEGLGKTRLMEELLIEAKLAGAIPLSPVNKRAASERFAVARQLIDQLVANAPESLAELDEDDRVLLAGEFPMLRRERPSLLPLIAPAELRHRQQAALARWFQRASRQLRLLIAVEDAHTVDEESLALLTSLASADEHTRLRLALSLRPSDARETPAVRVIRRQGACLRLEPLTHAEVDELVTSLFGDVPNLQRVAHWMHARSRGNPLECIELAHYLVERGIVHYSEGIWMLPATLPRESPQGLQATRHARLAALTAEQRAVVQAVAIFACPVPLHLCARVSEVDELAAFRALDELVRMDVLTLLQTDHYLCSAEGLREAIERATPPELLAQLHERAGQLLLEYAASDLRTRVRAAHHLLRGSSRLRGAELLVAIARDPNVPRDAGDFLTAPFELALQVCEELQPRAADGIALRTRLVTAAFLYDRSLVRHVDPLLSQLHRACGLDLLASVDPGDAGWLGRLLELADRRWAETPEAERSIAPHEAMTSLAAMSAVMLAVAILRWDLPLIDRVWARVKPLAALGSASPLAAAPELVGLALQGLRVGEASNHEQREAYLARLRDLTRYPGFPEARRQSILSTQHHNIGMATSALDGETALRFADEIDALGLQMYQGAAMQVRFMVHMYRGELERAQACRARLDVLAVQGGAGTQFELWLAPYLADPYALWDDALGLKQAAAHLERIAATDPGYGPMALVARGNYHRVRGEYPKALAAFDEADQLAPRDQHASWLLSLCGRVETLLAAEDYGAALRSAQELLETAHYAPRFMAVIEHRLAYSLAIARAHVGELAGAIAGCEQAIARELQLGKSPLHLGRLHEARVRIALVSGDAAAYAHDLVQVQQHFGSTNNPALIRRYERLVALGRARFGLAGEPGSEGDAAACDALDSLLAVTDVSQRAHLALQLVCREMSAESGYFYLFREGQVELAATIGSVPPPADLEETLTAIVRATLHASDMTATLSGSLRPGGESTTILCGEQAFVPIPLGAAVDGVHAIVGVLAFSTRLLEKAPLPDGRLLAGVARLFVAQN
ncbi:MAG TPA: protein kinase [Polyangiales bacterium]|nr:protein kinase [Polyangiales bacterium]